MSLMEELNYKALRLGIPLSVHLDVTYRCNERCEHCYLDHEDYGEMQTAEIRGLLDQLAEAGVFFLTISGGEALVRRDIFEIIEHARRLHFSVKLKTNALLIGEREARRLRALAVEQVQVSVYSDRAEAHDAVTKVRGSFERTLAGIRAMRAEGLKVTLANVLMRGHVHDGQRVRALAAEMGARYALDPTITPMMNGDTSVLRLRLETAELTEVFHDAGIVGSVEEFCTPPPAVDEGVREGYPCSAGHTACYISPYGDLYPCVQFPLKCGNVREQRFVDIWAESPQLKEVRSIRGKDLTSCSSCRHLGSCTRCPGLAYMEGDMRGPSSADCQKSFVRTGIPSAGMLRSSWQRAPLGLVQIQSPAARGGLRAAPMR